MRKNSNLSDSYLYGRDCSICLEKLNKNKVYLNCSHYFHKDCINKWKTRNNTCPICRTRITLIKEALTIKKIIRIIIFFIALIFITKFLLKALFIVLKFIFALVLNIVKVPVNFIITFLKISASIIYLIIIISLKFCKNIILQIFSFVRKGFGSIGAIFDLIINYMNKIKINLENISRDL